MKKTKITELNELGQSIWLDYISHFLIASGRLNEMIDLGLRGMTSNPTIFDKSIGSGNDYDGIIQKLCTSGKSTLEIYDDLTIKDIQDAADIFMPVYKQTRGLDGYVSLEINPKLAFNTQETIKEGRRLYQKVRRPNVMFKVPSTQDGFLAVEELIASGINVNITLIFSVEQYINTADAYIRGIRRLIDNSGNARGVRSVASVFVSRIDTVVDKLLDEKSAGTKNAKIAKQLEFLKGKAAVGNSQLIYKKFMEIFYTNEFKQLQDKGANIQRVLWGSTSTKNPVYSDIKYITELIAKDTVNTVPQATLEAFLDHGRVKQALGCEAGDAQILIDELRSWGIDINAVCLKLLEDGVTAFEKSFDSLLATIQEKTKTLCKI
jgi:transaldolase